MGLTDPRPAQVAFGLGVTVTTSETEEAWNVFFADLVARGLHGVKLVTSDAHRGLVEAIAANLPGTTWQRCRTHYAANLTSSCPKSAWPAVKTMLHSVNDQPDPKSVHAQFDKVLDTITESPCSGRTPRQCPRRRARLHQLPQIDVLARAQAITTDNTDTRELEAAA